MVSLSPRISQNTLCTELFSPNNNVLLPKFFSSSNMLFIRLFLGNTWKNKKAVTGLVSPQTTVKCGHGFGDHSQDGDWRGGDWDETPNGPHVMRREGCAM